MDIVITYQGDGGEFHHLDIVQSEKYYNFQISEDMFYKSRNVTIQDGLKHLYKETKDIDPEVLNMDLSRIQFIRFGTNVEKIKIVFNSLHFHLRGSGYVSFVIKDHTKSYFKKYEAYVTLIDMDYPYSNEIFSNLKNLVLKGRRDQAINNVIKNGS